MKVRIISYENVNSWILGKFARKLYEELTVLGAAVEIGSESDPTADINHHILYLGYNPSLPSKNDTLMITHIDDLYKLSVLKKQMQVAKLGICMSRDTMEKLISAGIAQEKLCFVNPAHDGLIPPKRWRIGITSRLYPDGCKREDLLEKLSTKLTPELFEFSIMGAGWESIVQKMQDHGIKVNYFPDFDYEGYVELMRSLDYYLYLGMDEGSMGFVDALSAGIKTIVTAQGFHLDAPNGITHSFTEFNELMQIFKHLEGERLKVITSVEDWTWPGYATKHHELWKYVLDGATNVEYSGEQRDGLVSLLDKDKTVGAANDAFGKSLLWQSIQKKLISIRRIRSFKELKEKVARKIAK